MIPVCAAVILRSGAVLLCRRAAGRKHGGLWEFPGGRIEDGETPQAALARELKEELGIDAVIGEEAARTKHAYDFGEIELIAFFVKSFTGELKLKDHDETKWVEARRLLEYTLTPADIPIAEVLASYKRRPRYSGTHPKKFEEKYKELAGDAQAVAKAKERGSTPAGRHLPIMVAEVLEALSPLEGAAVLDCTLGWGGHTRELAKRGAQVIALDRDREELLSTASRLKSEGLKVTTVHMDFAGAAAALRGVDLQGVDALLADLGVSSMQLDRPERGLSFKNDGPLDMRMDRSHGMTAGQWLAASSQEEIARALAEYGDEPDALKIAAALVDLRRQGRFPQTTFQLAAVVSSAKGLGPERVAKKDAFSAHPATRTFQALRIAVNDERDSLSALLKILPDIVKPGGRVAFLTFHSGEEKLVEAALTQDFWRAPLEAPRRASPAEVRENPRARSARLWRAVRRSKGESS